MDPFLLFSPAESLQVFCETQAESQLNFADTNTIGITFTRRATLMRSYISGTGMTFVRKLHWLNKVNEEFV